MADIEDQKTRDADQTRDRRDKPVEREGDKDIKEGGIAGARRSHGKPDRQ
jgi:hypothetical protein